MSFDKTILSEIAARTDLCKAKNCISLTPSSCDGCLLPDVNATVTATYNFQNSFQIGGVQLTATATQINNLVDHEHSLDDLTDCTAVNNSVYVGTSNPAVPSPPADNTVVGSAAGAAIESGGVKNTLIGSAAGAGITTGTNNTVLGYNASASGPTASNEITLGNADVTTLRCADTTIASLSDRRDKTEIVDSVYGEEFINRLRPVQYRWKTREGAAKDGKRRVGFIAQELRDAMPNGENEILDLVYEANPKRLEAKYGNLVPILVKAVQELSASNRRLRASVVRLESHLGLEPIPEQRGSGTSRHVTKRRWARRRVQPGTKKSRRK